MADVQLKKKVYEVLKRGYFNGPDDAVDVSDGPEDSIHLVIVSRKFDGKRLKEKNDLIWSQLSGLCFRSTFRNDGNFYASIVTRKTPDTTIAR